MKMCFPLDTHTNVTIFFLLIEKERKHTVGIIRCFFNTRKEFSLIMTNWEIAFTHNDVCISVPTNTNKP